MERSCEQGLRRDRTLRAGNNAAAVRGNVDTGDRLVVALQNVCQLESISSLAVQLDGRVPGNSQSCVVGRERVVGNGVVEQVVNFGSSHFCGSWCNRSSSLLSPRKRRDYTGFLELRLEVTMQDGGLLKRGRSCSQPDGGVTLLAA